MRLLSNDSTPCTEKNANTHTHQIPYKYNEVNNHRIAIIGIIVSICRRHVMPFALIHIYCYSFLFMWKSSHHVLQHRTFLFCFPFSLSLYLFSFFVQLQRFTPLLCNQKIATFSATLVIQTISNHIVYTYKYI